MNATETVTNHHLHAVFFIFLALAGASATAQPRPQAALRAQGERELFIALRPGDHDDPAYTVYKEGYGLILDEQWAKARRKFDEIFSRYPSSRFAEDARYWSAYALARIDRRRALEKYSQFLKNYPSSRYCPDAVADVAALHAVPLPVPTPMPDSARLPHGSIVFNGSMPNIRALALNFERMKRTLRHRLLSLKMIRLPGANLFPFSTNSPEEIDEATRLKIETLRALGDTREDEKSFQTFRQIALDQKQSASLREVAIDELTRVRSHDPLPTLVEVAGGDSNEEIRNLATLNLGEMKRDKTKSLDALTGLFRSLPPARREQRAYILDAVAETGGEKALAFLAGVARQSEDSDLQASAIDYLGEASRDKGKSLDILFDLFESLPHEKKDARQTILYSVADIGNDRAVDFLIKVARSGDDDQLRSDAVCLLGNIGGEKAKSALYEILLGR